MRRQPESRLVEQGRRALRGRAMSRRSPDERSDIRDYLAVGPACRYAHAGYAAPAALSLL
jgi:hypothetical protein